MGVFNGVTKVCLAVADPGTDHLLPKPASLMWKNIDNVHALEGTHGFQAALIHGDRQRRITGSQIRNVQLQLRTIIDCDQTHGVKGNQTVLVTGKHKEILAGRCQQSILGPHVVFNGTVRNETRLGPRSRVYGELEVHDSNSGNTITASDHEERYGTSSASHSFDYQMFGTSWQFVGFQLVGYLLTLSGTVLDGVIALMHPELVLGFYEHHVIHSEQHLC